MAASDLTLLWAVPGNEGVTKAATNSPGSATAAHGPSSQTGAQQGTAATTQSEAEAVQLKPYSQQASAAEQPPPATAAATAGKPAATAGTLSASAAKGAKQDSVAGSASGRLESGLGQVKKTPAALAAAVSAPAPPVVKMEAAPQIWQVSTAVTHSSACMICCKCVDLAGTKEQRHPHQAAASSYLRPQLC